MATTSYPSSSQQPRNARSLSTSSQLPSPLDPVFEPDDEWKSQCRSQIERGLSDLAQKTKEEKSEKLQALSVKEANGDEGVEDERQRIERDFDDTMKSLRRIAEEQFREALDRERMLRRKTATINASNRPPPERTYSSGSASIIQEQQEILDQIQRQRRRSELQSEERPSPSTFMTEDSNGIITPISEDAVFTPSSPGPPSSWAEHNSSEASSGRQSRMPNRNASRGPERPPSSSRPPQSQFPYVKSSPISPMGGSQYADYFDYEAEEPISHSYQSQSNFPASVIGHRQSNGSLSSSRVTANRRPGMTPPSESAMSSNSRTMNYASSSPSPANVNRRNSNTSNGGYQSGIATSTPPLSSQTQPQTSRPSPSQISPVQYRSGITAAAPPRTTVSASESSPVPVLSQPPPPPAAIFPFSSYPMDIFDEDREDPPRNMISTPWNRTKPSSTVSSSTRADDNKAWESFRTHGVRHQSSASDFAARRLGQVICILSPTTSTSSTTTTDSVVEFFQHTALLFPSLSTA
ncbi:hypothetical protein C8Q75DRAFT_462108 [Abortiporus biennis]|nr:hypothetical protein C8Q75DRAFT_462108 [Abortiporus biennis]